MSQPRLSHAWSHSVQYADVSQFAFIFGRRTLLPERAIHFHQASLDQMLGSRTRLRLEAYSRQDRDLLFRSLLEPRLLNGTYFNFNRRAAWGNNVPGYSRGYRITLQRRAVNNLTSWISYGYGATRSTDGVTRNRFVADFDQHHTIQVIASYRIRPTINFSAKHTYGSGMPVREFYEERGGLNYLSANRNLLRVPSYQRLDLRINKVFVLKHFQATLFAEVINVTNHSNKRFDSLRSFDARIGRATLTFDQTIPILPSARCDVRLFGFLSGI